MGRKLSTGRATFTAVHPVLPVRDVREAILFYTRKLGFTLLFQDSAAGCRYAGVGRDRVELHLQWHDATDFQHVERLNLRFMIDRVESLFDEYRTRSVFHSQTVLRDTDWGTREFAFYDPDGNALTFYRDL